MTQSVLIIDCTDRSYNGQTHSAQALGGIQRCVVQLSAALARRGMKVGVWNNTPEHVTKDGVEWHPKNTKSIPAYNVVIACNDACLFDAYTKISGHREFLPVVWFHNPVRLGKIIRKGRIIPLLRWRPIGVFLGQDQKKRATPFLPLRFHTIIHHGLEPEIIDYTAKNPDKVRAPVAVYISQAYRGLDDMVSLWTEKIQPAVPAAEFRVYGEARSGEDTASFPVKFAGKLPRRELVAALEEARVCLIPGHEDETFCLAAAEATALQIPVITYGTGALKERVQDGVNGYIVANREEFAAKLMDILQDDQTWKRLRSDIISSSPKMGWDKAADLWLALFKDKASHP